MPFRASTETLRGQQLQTLNAVSRKRETSVERLSSGLRINRAADDAAGLAISEAAKARIRSRNQAIRNIQDGISALQTADGGMSQLGSMLGRMRELALQSANGVYGTAERNMLHQELTSLVRAVDETAEKCEFNERPLLRANMVDVVFVIDGSNSMGGEIATLRDSIDAFRQAFASASISVQFGLVESSRTDDPVDSTIRVLDIGDPGIETALDNIELSVVGQDPYAVLYNLSGINDRAGTREPDAVTFRDGAQKRVVVVTDTGKEMNMPGVDPSQTNLANALAAESIIVDVVASPGYVADFDELTATTGGTFFDKGDANGSGIPGALNDISDTVAEFMDGANSERIVIHSGVEADQSVEIGLPVELTSNSLGIGALDITTQQGALDALSRIDQAMDLLSEARAHVGASQNALDMAREVQTHAVEADTAMRSRITDADVAAEASDMAAADVIAQSTLAMTAQTSRLDEQRVLTLIESAK